MTTNQDLGLCLLNDIKSKDLEQIQSLIYQGADLSVRDELGNTVLHLAASRGDLKIISYITSKLGAVFNLDDQNNAGKTPLQIAEEMGHVSIQGYLTSLHNLALKDPVANVSEIDGDKSGDIVLEYQKLSHPVMADLKVLKILQEEEDTSEERKQANSDSKKVNHDYTPLILAVCKSDIETVKSLVEEELYPIFMNQLYEGARYAALSKDFEILKYLIDKGAGTTYVGPIQDLFHRIVYISYEDDIEITEEEAIEIMDYMIDKGVQGINAKDSIGATPLLYAMEYTYEDGNFRTDLFNYLLEKGCDLNDKDNYGRGVMHYATLKYSFGVTSDLVGWLIDQGFDINSKTTEGLSTMDLACNPTKGLLCIYPNIEINFKNDEIKKALMWGFKDNDIFKAFDGTFEYEFNAKMHYPILAAFNILKAFNRVKGCVESGKFAQKLSKQILTQIDESEIFKLPLNVSQDVYPRYAEAILYLIIYKVLVANQVELYGSIREEFINILPEVINANVLQQSSKISTTQDLMVELSSILSLKKVLEGLEINEPSIENATLKLQKPIESQMSRCFGIIRNFLEPVEKICKIKTKFQEVKDDGQKIEEFREARKKLLSKIPGAEIKYAVDPMYMEELWKEIYDLLDSYSSWDQNAPEDLKGLKDLVKKAIEVFKEEKCSIIQDFFKLEADKIEQLNIVVAPQSNKVLDLAFCEGIGSLCPDKFKDLMEYLKPDEVAEKFWGIKVPRSKYAESEDLIPTHGKRKTSQMDESTVKRFKAEMQEGGHSVAMTQTEGMDQSILITEQGNMTNIGELKDLT